VREKEKLKGRPEMIIALLKKGKLSQEEIAEVADVAF